MNLLAITLAMLSLPSYSAEPPIATALVRAESAYGLDSGVLAAIAKIESNNRSNASRVNKNGTIDIGVMQINSIHFGSTCREYNMAKLDDNVLCGAKILDRLKTKYEATDPNWIGRYHSSTPRRKRRYAARVAAEMSQQTGVNN